MDMCRKAAQVVLVVIVFSVWWASAACGTGDGAMDAAVYDAAVAAGDTGTLDAGDFDAAPADAGPADTTGGDPGAGDVWVPDGGEGDTGVADAGGDAGIQDAGPDCVGKICGADDGAGGKCTACPNAGEVCDAISWTCKLCMPGCQGRFCGDDDDCGGKCTSCAVDGEMCDASVWMCKPCLPDCLLKSCGDDDGCGGQCVNLCPNAGEVCDPASFTCVADPCVGGACGDVAGGRICRNDCPGAAEQCETDRRDTAVTSCVACNEVGSPPYEFCASQTECDCGSDCVKLLEDPVLCDDDPAYCQPVGQCLAHCAPDLTCAPGRVCACGWFDEASQRCLDRNCFAHGRLTGWFDTITRPSCGERFELTDVGKGSVSWTADGETFSWDLFSSCHFVDPNDPSVDVVQINGFKLTAGVDLDPNVLTIFIPTASLVVGKLDMRFGEIVVGHDRLVFTGGVITERWANGWAMPDGYVEITMAGKTDDQPIAGNVDVMMIKYDLAWCGGNSGVTCE